LFEHNNPYLFKDEIYKEKIEETQFGDVFTKKLIANRRQAHFITNLITSNI